STLVGKELIVRYVERQPLAPQSAPADPPSTKKVDGSASANATTNDGFSIVPREKKLRIVGIIETEPAAGFGGFGNGRLFIPLDVAVALRAAQVTDLRDAVRAPSGKPTYANLTVRAKSPSQVEAIESSIKNMGFSTFSLLDATRNLRLFFT